MREHHAVQLMPAEASTITPRRLVQSFSSEGRRLAHDLSEGEILRKEAAGKMDVKRSKDGRIISAKELPPTRKRIDGRIVPVRVFLDQRSSGLYRVRYTEIDKDADTRPLFHRVRFK